MKKMFITFVAGSITFAIAAISLSLLLIFSVSGCGSCRAVYEDTAQYYVENGDTLWSIATECKAEGQDTRMVIAIIEELNGCNANIKAGQILDLPIFE